MSGLLHAARHSHIAEFKIQVFDLVLGGIDLLCFFLKVLTMLTMVCAFGPPQKIRSLQGRSVKEQLAEFVGDAQQRENVYLVLPGVPVNTNPVNHNQIWEVVNGCLMQVSLM